MRFLYSTLLISLLIPAIQADALDIPQRPQGYVSDYARVLSPRAKAVLEDTLSRFESDTTNQIAVATFESLEGEDLEGFSIRLAERWKLGQTGKDNGVIVLVFKNDRRVRIEVGYGLEGVLTDALCDIIIRNEIVPHFKKGDYDSGILSGIGAVIKAVSGEYKAEPSSRAELDILIGIFVIAMFLLIVALSLYAEYRRRKDGYWGASSRGDYYGGWGSHHGGGFGGGGFGGGGFGGGGGGFGGGGASGRW